MTTVNFRPAARHPDDSGNVYVTVGFRVRASLRR